MRKLRLFNFILLGILSLSSCGYRGDDSDIDDVFLGTWNVNEINCRVDEISPAIETYIIQTPIEIFQLEFKGRNFLFSAQVNSPSSCQVNVTAVMAADYEYSDAGTLSLYEVSSHSACNVDLDDVNGSVSNVTIPFGVNEAYSRDLDWDYDGGKLNISLPFIFSGSSGGPCSGSCTCEYELIKD